MYGSNLGISQPSSSAISKYLLIYDSSGRACYCEGFSTSSFPIHHGPRSLSGSLSGSSCARKTSPGHCHHSASYKPGVLLTLKPAGLHTDTGPIDVYAELWQPDGKSSVCLHCIFEPPIFDVPSNNISQAFDFGASPPAELSLESRPLTLTADCRRRAAHGGPSVM
jgi:hypothetical protein